MFTKSLVTSDKSQRFLNMLGIDAGRKAHLGDTDTMESGAKVYALTAHIAMRDGIAKVQALVDDKTRSEPQKHDAARKVANQTVEALTKAQANLKSRGETLTNEAMRDINSFFANRTAGDSVMRQDIRNWIKDSMKTPEGIARVKQEAKRDPRIAAELWEAPTYLTEVSVKFRDDITTDAIATFSPDAAQRLQDGVAITKLASDYSNIINEIPAHFYNPMVADEAATRVEV